LPADSERDAQYLARALELARQAIGQASPNPLVGAVVVKDGRIAGEGIHYYDQLKHAEIVALEQAGEAARGATLYINLEPCCHSGRTGPCTDAIRQAGVTRVVAGMEDPNPAVAGGGFKALRAAGVEVQDGCRLEECRELNEHFARYIRDQRPFVTLKAAMTLDGRIGAPDDSSGPSGERWITGEAAREQVHRLRHAHDALLTGVRTIQADDPLLTDRSGLCRRRPLLRVVLDSALRTPLSSRVVQGADQDLLIVCGAAADHGRQRELEARRVRVLRAPSSRPDLAWVLRALARREMISVLVEAGAAMNAAFLEAGLIDKVTLFYAPKLLGGTEAVPVFGGQGMRAIGAARPVRLKSIGSAGDDIVMEGYLQDVYGHR
jgi:diaminohydroxyphosphoribosylaminopyrimidine deaminase/5-amino-6-(5-phosphoribosylamino)uracil reductase